MGRIVICACFIAKQALFLLPFPSVSLPKPAYTLHHSTTFVSF